MSGDICHNYHGGNADSLAAYASLDETTKEALQDQIEALVSEAPSGMICDDVEVAMGLRHQTASARITELLASNRLIRTALRRETRSGRKAGIVVTPANWRPEMGRAKGRGTSYKTVPTAQEVAA
jgi:hypothetical protein